MDDGGLPGNGFGKADPYKSTRAQWMISPNHFKDQQKLKLVEAVAERDAAIHEMNLAMAEKKQAIAERDIALFQRDQALNDMNKVIVERDSALAALEYTRENSGNSSGIGCPLCPCNCSGVLIAKQMHREAAYNVREMHITRAHPISLNADNVVKPLHDRKHPGGAKPKAHIAAKKEKQLDGKRKKTPEGLEVVHDITDEDLNDVNTVIKNVWKGEDMGLNIKMFDESTMSAPGCSCTGVWRQCYKWGNGGWQSACCTNTLSMHPLPMLTSRKHARVGGRKMSGGAFLKLLNRLAAEGHDLSLPVDLKVHWAKHGTNRKQNAGRVSLINDEAYMGAGAVY